MSWRPFLNTRDFNWTQKNGASPQGFWKWPQPSLKASHEHYLGRTSVIIKSSLQAQHVNGLNKLWNIPKSPIQKGPWPLSRALHKPNLWTILQSWPMSNLNKHWIWLGKDFNHHQKFFVSSTQEQPQPLLSKAFMSYPNRDIGQ